MKSENEIFQTVKEIICEKTELAESEITMEAQYRDDLNISSIVIVSVILAVETEFGFEVSDEEIVEMTSVGDAVRFIRKKLEEKESSAA